MTTFAEVNQQIIATDNTGQKFNLNHSTVLIHYSISKVLQSTDVLLDRRSMLMRAYECSKTDDMRKGVTRELCAIDYLLDLNNPAIDDI